MSEMNLEAQIAVLQEQVRALIEDKKQRATREWAVIMAVGGLILTVFGKSVGFLQ